MTAAASRSHFDFEALVRKYAHHEHEPIEDGSKEDAAGREPIDHGSIIYVPPTAASALRYTVVTQNANATVKTSDSVTLATSGAGGITLTLPTAVGNTGLQLIIKKVDTGAGAVTVDGNAAETIDGNATYSIVAANESVTLVSDGANWVVV